MFRSDKRGERRGQMNSDISEIRRQAIFLRTIRNKLTFLSQHLTRSVSRNGLSYTSDEKCKTSILGHPVYILWNKLVARLVLADSKFPIIFLLRYLCLLSFACCFARNKKSVLNNLSVKLFFLRPQKLSRTICPQFVLFSPQ